jgi:hypothetical protein
MALKIVKQEEYEGLSLFIGTLPTSGIAVVARDPWGNEFKARSGDKKEYGEGGFEIYTPYPVDYVLRIFDDVFTIRGGPRVLRAWFEYRDEDKPEPEPEPEPGIPHSYWQGIPDWLGSADWPLRPTYEPWTTVKLPKAIRGRPLSRRGMHWGPMEHHDYWMQDRAAWMNRCLAMDISWVVLLNSGDSVIAPINGIKPVEVFLEHGIYPIIRDMNKINREISSMDTIDETVKIFAKYDATPTWIAYNEYMNNREWPKRRGVPSRPEAKRIFVRNLLHSIGVITDHGAYAGIPDGPDYDWDIIKAVEPAWDKIKAGQVVFCPHNYGLGRPVYAPYDAATQHGIFITEEGREFALDDFHKNRSWYDVPTEWMNRRRVQTAQYGLTAAQMGTCFLAYERVAEWSVKHLGFVLPMMATETLWTPRDRPGTDQSTIDIRFDYTTPEMVGRKAIEAYNAATPLLSINQWIIADDAMCVGGFHGWPFESLYGWAYRDMYGLAKPAVDWLREEKATPVPWDQFVVLGD